MTEQHLTDEEFSDLLADQTATSSAATHLEACEECRNELNSLRAATDALRTLGLDQAEKRAACIAPPMPSISAWRWLSGWGMAASLLLCGVALSVHFRRVEQARTSGAGQTIHIQTRTVAAPDADELADDNELLRSIDHELNQQVLPQVSVSELSVSATANRENAPREVSN